MSRSEEKRIFCKMLCKITNKEEEQEIVKESEDGITLRCKGCGKVHSHEIGFFAEMFE